MCIHMMHGIRDSSVQVGEGRDRQQTSSCAVHSYEAFKAERKCAGFNCIIKSECKSRPSPFYAHFELTLMSITMADDS
jgi:hypothetical protein